MSPYNLIMTIKEAYFFFKKLYVINFGQFGQNEGVSTSWAEV
jgi:hypothetical protein